MMAAFTQAGIPGEAISIYPGGADVGPCPPSLGLCLDLGSPFQVLGTGVADATGTVSRSVTVPGPAGAVYSVQGVAVRGTSSQKSNLLTGTVQP